MSPLIVSIYAITAIAFIDALRRSSSEWLGADRNRAFWLIMIVFLNVLGALAYALFVLPCFAGKPQVDDEFRKRSSDMSLRGQGGIR
jgi:hypothetical protein